MLLTKVNDNTIKIEFRYMPHLVEAVKEIPGRRFDGESKCWVAPVTSLKEVEAFARRYGFRWADAPQPKEVVGAIPPMPELTQEISLALTPFPYQKQGIAYALLHKKCIVGDQPGLGKAQPLSAKIATPNGFVKMGDLRIGSKIFGKNGLIYVVEAIYTQGIRSVYEVTFNDGSSTKCDLEHLWTVRDVNRRRRGKGWTVKTLYELMASGLLCKQNTKREASGRKPVLKWEIPICEPVKYTEKEYVIHPYIMGMLLGDGCLTGEICISIPDFQKESIERIQNYLPENLKLSVNTCPDCPQYYITQTGTTHKNPFKREIERLGLSVLCGKLHIPSEYLMGSVEQRIDLLRGLMDADGSAKDNRITFHTCSDKLASGVKELVESLGGNVIMRYYDRSHENKSNEWQVNIRLNICPFYLTDKVKNWNTRKHITRYISNIKHVGEEPVQCIKVTAPDHLYLTDGYIVTHNTGQAIATIVGAEAFPCLIICPATLKENWRREVEMWTGGKRRAAILSDGNKRTFHQFFKAGLADFCITNYESLKKFFVESINVPEGKRLILTYINFKQDVVNSFRSVIIDESHRCKNGAAQQTKFCMGICRGKEYALLLTGTPIVNRPKDLIPQLHIMDMLPKFGGYKTFVDRYCGGQKQASNLGELNYKLRTTCFYQREKKDVLKDLPDKMRQTVLCDISNRKEYNQAETDLIQYLRKYRDADDEKIAKAMRGQAMVMINILRQISAKGKVESVKEFINDLLESGEKVILFVSLHEIVLALKKLYPKAVTVTGMDTKESRQLAVDSFQRNPDTKIIICSIKAAGVGLTLTASSRVAFVEFPWTYADCCQCEDRAHRIGQKDSVTCHYFLGQNTIDEKVYQIIQTKKDIANKATGITEDIEENVVDMVANLFSNRF